MRFVALGRTQWLYDTIVALAEAGHEPVLILTGVAAPEYTVGPDDFEALAQRLGCPFAMGGRLDDAAMGALLDQAQAPVAVSINWPTLMPESVLDRFEHGVLNGHAGDLPRYRGNAAPNWAILRGETEVVVTVHRMVAELDAGPIIAKRRFPITDQTYIGDVYAFMQSWWPMMFVEALDGLEAGTLEPRPQDPDRAASLRVLPRNPEDALIDWAQSADSICRLVRASAEPFSGAFTYMDGERLTVWRARAAAPAVPTVGVPGQVVAVDPEQGVVDVLTGDGLLRVEQAQRQGDAERTLPTNLIRSTRTRLGMNPVVQIETLARRLAELECRLSDDRAR